MNKKPRELFRGNLRRGLTVVASVLKEKLPENHVLCKSETLKGKSHKFRKEVSIKEPSRGFELNVLEKKCLEDASWIFDNLVNYADKLKEGVDFGYIEPTTFSLFPLMVITYDFFRKDEESIKYCEDNKISNFPTSPCKGFTQIRDLISNYLHGENNNDLDRIYTSMFLDKVSEEEENTGLHNYEKTIKILLENYSSIGE